MTTKKSSAKPPAATARRARAKRTDPDLLILWTARFAVMIGAGVTLVRSLSILEQETADPTLQAVARDLREKIEAGETLSQAMSHHPGLFGPVYLRMVRAGEVGGVLEVTLNRLNELLAAGVAQRARHGRLDRRALADWLWTFGTLLKSGVPILLAMDTIAEGAPKGLREATLEIREAVRQGGRISDGVATRGGLFGPMTTALIAIGEAEGRLDQVLLDLAEWYERHLLPLEAAGKLPRLTAKAVKRPPVSTEVGMPTGEIIRRVNQLIQKAIDQGVERIELRPTGDDRGVAACFAGGKHLQSVSLDYYASIVRRVKVMADIEPYGVRPGRGRIHIRYKDKEYYASVHAEADGLVLSMTSK